ncbi:MAG TPA: hypothetical protein VF811_05090 [Parasulfuritortus sp.]
MPAALDLRLDEAGKACASMGSTRPRPVSSPAPATNCSPALVTNQGDGERFNIHIQQVDTTTKDMKPATAGLLCGWPDRPRMRIRRLC